MSHEKQKHNEYCKNYQKGEHWKQYQREWRKEKYNSDDMFMRRVKISNFPNRVMRFIGSKINSEVSKLPYWAAEAIKRKWTEASQKNLHVDHILPISLLLRWEIESKIKIPMEYFFVGFNLNLVSHEDNSSKSNGITEEALKIAKKYARLDPIMFKGFYMFCKHIRAAKEEATHG